MKCGSPPATKGRPREFCVDQALAAALGVFWAKGYDGASMTDLTEAMGITRPSLYAAFGNKEALFHKALDLYEAEKLAYVRTALEQPTARAVVEHILRGALDAQSGECGPRGCLGVISATACGPDADSIRAHLIERRQSAQAALVDRFERARIDGDLPDGIDAQGLTWFLYALLQGMAVLTASGAPRPQVEGAIDTALAMWPDR